MITRRRYIPLFYKQPIPNQIKMQMEGISMQHISGITYNELTYLTITHYDFEGKIKQGHMIVNYKIADEVLKIFEELYKIKYPIEKMEIIDNFAGKQKLIGDKLDYESIEVNNTSAFNDRLKVTDRGVKKEISLHALRISNRYKSKNKSIY